MSKSTYVGCHLDPWNLQLTTACRSRMSAAVNAGDWLAEIDQVSSSHITVSTLVHLNAQAKPNPVCDIQPVEYMAPEMGWSSIVLYLPQFDTTRAAALKTRCSLAVVFFGEPASRPTPQSTRLATNA